SARHYRRATLRVPPYPPTHAFNSAGKYQQLPSSQLGRADLAAARVARGGHLLARRGPDRLAGAVVVGGLEREDERVHHRELQDHPGEGKHAVEHLDVEELRVLHPVRAPRLGVDEGYEGQAARGDDEVVAHPVPHAAALARHRRELAPDRFVVVAALDRRPGQQAERDPAEQDAGEEEPQRLAERRLGARRAVGAVGDAARVQRGPDDHRLDARRRELRRLEGHDEVHQLELVDRALGPLEREHDEPPGRRHAPERERAESLRVEPPPGVLDAGPDRLVVREHVVEHVRADPRREVRAARRGRRRHLRRVVDLLAERGRGALQDHVPHLGHEAVDDGLGHPPHGPGHVGVDDGGLGHGGDLLAREVDAFGRHGHALGPHGLLGLARRPRGPGGLARRLFGLGEESFALPFASPHGLHARPERCFLSPDAYGSFRVGQLQRYAGSLTASALVSITSL
ncbi:unnamed protein product, partial [Pelagomonas calceolata]